MNEKNIKIIDLFCGIGGLSLGFEKAGFKSVLALDKWDQAIETFNYNRQEKVAKKMDICNFNRSSVEKLKRNHDIDGIVGGPPCQGFSTVGTRKVNDERNYLYLEFFRLVKEIMPKFFVIENVKGLLTLNDGMFEKNIKKRFGSNGLGYNIKSTILDAADYGVPQHRERVFFVGVKSGNFQFPDPLNYKISTLNALSDLPSLDNRGTYKETYEYPTKPLNEYQKEMRKNSDVIYNHDYTNHQQKTIDVISKVPDGGNIKDLPKEYWEIRKYNKAFQRMNSKLPSHTIDTGHRNYFHFKENRVPSVRERCRIQSFPDDFILKGTKTSKKRQIGNAVPPLLAFHIAKGIKKML